MGAPKVNVNIVVTNTHGGTATSSNFTAVITGANASPSTFQGTATTTVVSIDASSSYSVALQTLPNSYTYATSTGCAGVLTQGSSALCTISVQDVQATTTITGTNLILNPNLSTPDPSDTSAPQYWAQDYWGTNTHTFTYPVAGKVASSSAAQVAITAYTDGDAKWAFQNVTVTPTHTYTYTDEYQSNIPSQIEVEYTYTDGTLGYANATAEPAVLDWGSATLTFTVPAGVASVRVLHYIDAVGTIRIDQASLVDTNSSTPPPTTGTNLVANPTFTTVSADPTLPQSWSHGGWGTNTATFSYPVAGKTGHTAAQVGITAYTDGDAKWASDPIRVTPGHTYIYTDLYQSSVPSTLVVEYTDLAGNFTYTQYTPLSASASAWATSTISFAVPTGTVSARVFHYIEAVGSLTLDSVSLVDAGGSPPPSVNLVTNPSFVVANAADPTLPQSWSHDEWGTNTATFSYPVAGQTSSSTAAQVAITAYTDGDAKWVMGYVPATAGASYTYSDTYQSNIASELVVEYTSSTNVVTYGNFTPIGATASAWGSASVTFTPPTNTASIRVFHLIAGVGSLTIDGTSVVLN